MKIPTFPECDRALLKPLIHLSDYDLVDKLQKLPTDGRYFTALFCRYSPVVYSLIRHSARSPVQADYLFALTWRHILNELGGIDLASFQSIAQPLDHSPVQPSDSEVDSEIPQRSSTPKAFSLQAWLIGLTAAHINQAVLPDVADIHYALQDAPPPLWCYTERALESLLPRHRLIILMAQTFAWSNTRIAAYLQAEGEQISPSDLNAELKAAYQALEQALPADIRAIYLDCAPLLAPSANQEINQAMSERSTGRSADMAAEMSGMMTIEFDEVDAQLG
ncbi:MAG: sigma-70 family RNA polymerase sigma factor [Phormidesmis sp.]